MSFIHVTFLAAGLAVILPWLLHLTRRRKYLRLRIGSLQFLEPLVRDRHRMSRIEHWPLLILRCLALLLLAFLFARPFFPKPSATPPASGEFLVMLDASGSITDAQATAIRQQAEKVIRDLPPSGTPILAIFADRVEIIESLDDYQPIPGAGGDPAAAVDWIVNRAAGAPDALAGVHWFTDLQAASLPISASRLWPSGVTAEIHPVMPESQENASIDGVELLTPFGSGEWEVEVRVRVVGTPDSKPLKIALTDSDGKIHESTVPSSGGTARIPFSFEPAAGEPLVGDVSLVDQDDAWPVDNSRSFGFEIERPTRVVLVDGDPTESTFLSETYFLEKALHASSGGKELSPFRAISSTTVPTDPKGADVFAMVNVANPSASELQELRSRVDAGAGLMIFLGDQSQPSAWSNSGLVPPGLALLPEPSPDFVRVGDLTHPALAGLHEDALRGLGLRALTHRFTWPSDPDWQTVLAFGSDAPLMACHRTRPIVVLAHPVNREGSDLPLDPAFVPFMQGLFGYLSDRQKAPSSDPSGTAKIVLSSLSPGIDERRPPGRYPESSRLTVITANPLESDIRPASPEHFREVLGLPSADAPPAVLSPPAETVGTTHQREGEMWPWLLAGLLALLSVETAVAARRGRPTSTTAAHEA